MASPKTDVEAVRRWGFPEFVRLAWPIIEPGKSLIWEPHMEQMCVHLEAVARGEIRNLVVNVPPATSKTRIFSILYGPWDWIENPWRRFMHTTYDKELSIDMAKESLKLLTSDWYRERWSHLQIPDGAGASHFKNGLGGTRFSTMMGGAATGQHCHTLMVDDPIKPGSLEIGGDSAAAVMELAWRRWVGTFTQRSADAKTFARVCIMQRLHESDLAGRMIQEPGTVHLCLPMEFEPENACITEWGGDWRTEPGELLCPKRFPREVVEERRSQLSARDWAAQMQQRPAPQAGAIFQRESFAQRWSNLPVGARWLISVDAALKEDKQADFNVCQVWAWHQSQFYLVDQRRFRGPFSAVVDAVLELRTVYPLVKQVLIEDKANGTAVIQALKLKTSGVVPVNPEGGKVARANAVEPIVRAGNVWLPERPWTGAFIEEAVSFPVSAKDDQVDAMTQALHEMSGKQKSQRLRRAMANTRQRMKRMGY